MRTNVMNNPFAMAGLAEAAEFYSILIWSAVLGLTVALAVWGFVRRSKIAVWIAMPIISLAVVVVQPWWDFITQPTQIDPDAVDWANHWRMVSGFLIAGFLFCLAALVRVMRTPRKPIQDKGANGRKLGNGAGGPPALPVEGER